MLDLPGLPEQILRRAEREEESRAIGARSAKLDDRLDLRGKNSLTCKDANAVAAGGVELLCSIRIQEDFMLPEVRERNGAPAHFLDRAETREGAGGRFRKA